MAADAHRVAPGSRNVVRTTKMHLFDLELCKVELPLPPNEREDPKWLAKTLRSLKGSLLENASLIVVPLNDGTSSQLGDPIPARSSKLGIIVRASAGELDGPAPAPKPENWLMFEEGQKYAIFWSLHANVTKAVLAAFLRDRQKAFVRHDFFVFSPEPSQLFDGDLKRHFELHRTEERRLGVMFEAIESGTAGYLPEAVLEEARLLPERGEGRRFLLARRPAYHALRLAQLLYGAYLDISYQSLEADAASEALGGMADAALATKSIPGAGVDLKKQRWARLYIKYAYDCAEADIDRDLFFKATTVLANQPDKWGAAGEKIAEKGITHPCADGTKFIDSDIPLAHYDYFKFAFRHAPESPWRRRLGHVRVLRQKQAERVSKRIHSFVARQLCWPKLLKDLGARHPGGTDVLDRIHLEFLVLSTTFEACWWESFDVDDSALIDGQYLGWFATALDKVGGSLDSYFTAANAPLLKILGEEAEKFPQLATKLTTLASSLGTETVTVPASGTRTLHVDFREIDELGRKVAKNVTVVDSGRIVGSLEFELFDAPHRYGGGAAYGARGGAVYSAATSQSYRQSTVVKVTELKVKEPKVARALGAFGSWAGLGLSLATLRKDLSEKSNVIVAGRVVQNVFQAIDSGEAAMALIARAPWAANYFKIGAEKLAAKTVGVGLEAALNVYEGVYFIMKARDEDTSTAEATVLTAKGVVMFASGAGAMPWVTQGVLAGFRAGAGGFLEASAAYMAIPAYCVAGAAITIVLIDVMWQIHKTPDDATKGMEDAHQKAIDEELPKDVDTYDISRTYDAIEVYLRDFDRAVNTL